MGGIELPTDFDRFYNCTYTTTGEETVHVDIAALMKVVSEMPEMPKLFTMPIKIIRNPALPENFIILSESVAGALEEAIEKARAKR